MKEDNWRLKTLQAVVFVPPMGSTERRLIAPYTRQRLQMLARSFVKRIEHSGDAEIDGLDAFIMHTRSAKAKKTAREIAKVCCDDMASQTAVRSALDSNLSGIEQVLRMIPDDYPYHVRFLVLVLDFRPSLFEELFEDHGFELIDSGEVSANIYYLAQKGGRFMNWDS